MADDTSLFSVVQNVNTSIAELNNDFIKINKCAHQWKMSLKPDPNEQGQQVVFSRKVNRVSSTFGYLITLYQATTQTYLGIILDNRFII